LGLRLDCQHWAAPGLLRDALTAPKYARLIYRWTGYLRIVLLLSGHKKFSPLRTDSLPLVSKMYWPENANDAIMDAP